VTRNLGQATQYKNVFPIDTFRDGTSSPTIDINEIITQIFDSKEFEMGVKNMVESHIIAKWYSDLIYRKTETVDNPFDAVYLADLEPDIVNNQDIVSIQTFSGIKDLSGTIQFNDGWDD
jgi:hypothetical protein